MKRAEDVAKDLPTRHCRRGAHFEVGQRSEGGALVDVRANILEEVEVKVKFESSWTERLAWRKSIGCLLGPKWRDEVCRLDRDGYVQEPEEQLLSKSMIVLLLIMARTRDERGKGCGWLGTDLDLARTASQASTSSATSFLKQMP